MFFKISWRPRAAGRLLAFCWPIFLTNSLSIIYALVDLAVVGRWVGEIGLAAVANGSILAYIIGSAGTGLALGGTVVIGHYKGAERESDQRESLTSLLFLAFLFSAIVTPVCLFSAETVLRFLRVPEAAFPDALAYLTILSLGHVFFYTGTALCFSLRGLGDSRSPLIFMLIGGLVNVGLDLLLVGPLGLGVRGAAAATVAAQAASLMFASIYLRRRSFIYGFSLSGFKVCRDKVRLILRTGIPAMVQLMVINLSFLLVTALLNQYGPAVAAAAGVGLKISTLAVMPCWAIGQALTAMVANSLGAGKSEEAELLARAALRLNLLVTVLVVAVIQFWAGPLMVFFQPLEGEVVKAGVTYLRFCCSAGVIIYAVMYTCNCLATGAGAATLAMINSFVDSLFVRVGLIWLLSRAGLGLTAIYLGQAFSTVPPALMGLLYFYKSRWSRKRLI